MRGVIVRTNDEIAEHDADIWQVADLIRLARHSNRWPRYVGSCVLYNSTCDYWHVCAEGGDIQGPLYQTRPQMNAPGAPHGPPLTPEEQAADEKKRLPVLSPSAITTWRQCPRKYYYGYELRRRRIGEDSKPLYFGKLIHKAFGAYHESKDGDFDPSVRSIDRALAVCDTAEDPYDRAHARALMRGYDARWFNAPLRVIATEKPFTRPLRNPDTGAASRTFELGGVVDAVIEETNNAG